jgi:tetratricopeptide (TPR) repeat protein
MSMLREHELVTPIRDWLAATSEVDIPPGISRDDARAQGHRLLGRVNGEALSPNSTEASDDLQDILLASVEILESRESNGETFYECEKFFRYVSALPERADPFDERSDILHRVARFGWRCAPDGETIGLAARQAIWCHGDSAHHRDLCVSADRLPDRIEALQENLPELSELRDICRRLIRLASIRPSLTVRCVSLMLISLRGREASIGYLDDWDYLEATVCLAGAIAERSLGNWAAAEGRCKEATKYYSRTADRSDLDRVAAERLALTAIRGNHYATCRLAPSLIEKSRVPRDRLKAKLILAAAQLNIGRVSQSRANLESALNDPVMETEPGLKALALVKLGTALSYQNLDRKAMEAFQGSGEVLDRFYYPAHSADLAGSVGEHLAKLGKLEDAIVLYRSARQIYHDLGYGHLVGYINILLAELLMMLGRKEEAEEELILAIPLIEKFDLRREALAAVGLLREGLANRCTDVKAIRNVRNQLRG